MFPPPTVCGSVWVKGHAGDYGGRSSYQPPPNPLPKGRKGWRERGREAGQGMSKPQHLGLGLERGLVVANEVRADVHDQQHQARWHDQYWRSEMWWRYRC